MKIVAPYVTYMHAGIPGYVNMIKLNGYPNILT